MRGYLGLLLLVAVVFGVISMWGLVGAVECNSTIGNLSDNAGCTVSSNLTLETGTYYARADNLNGVLRFTASNIFIDCNNSIIIGNKSNNQLGINFNLRSNITVKNCNVQNYSLSYKMETGINQSLIYSTSTLSNTGIQLKGANSSLINGVYLSSSTIDINNFDSRVANNLIVNNITSITGSNVNYYTNLIISNSTFTNITRDNALVLDNDNNVTLINNRYINMTLFSTILVTNTNNLFSYNEYINLTSVGHWFRRSSGNLTIVNYTLDRAITNYDGMNVGILFENYTSNIQLSNSSITNVGSLGIYVMQSNNISIENIYIDNYPISSKISEGINDGNNFGVVGIGVIELYKTGTNNNLEQVGDNYTRVSKFKSSNVLIRNITFGNNVQIKLKTQGVQNLTTNITNYTHYSWQLPYLLDIEDNYINPLYSNLSVVNSSGYSNTLYQGYKSFAQTFRADIRYTWFSTYQYYKNNNWTWNYNSTLINNPNYPNFQINVYNFSMPIIYNSTLTSGTILNNNQVNLSISPLSEVYVRDVSWV